MIDRWRIRRYSTSMIPTSNIIRSERVQNLCRPQAQNLTLCINRGSMVLIDPPLRTPHWTCLLRLSFPCILNAVFVTLSFLDISGDFYITSLELFMPM